MNFVLFYFLAKPSSIVQYKTHSNLPYFLDLAPTPFKRRVDKAEFAISAVGVNSGLGVYSGPIPVFIRGPSVYSGSRRLFGVPAFIRGPAFIRTYTRKCYVSFSDVQGYEKTCYCYSLCLCLCSVSFVNKDILCIVTWYSCILCIHYL